MSVSFARLSGTAWQEDRPYLRVLVRSVSSRGMGLLASLKSTRRKAMSNPTRDFEPILDRERVMVALPKRAERRMLRVSIDALGKPEEHHDSTVR